MLLRPSMVLDGGTLEAHAALIEIDREHHHAPVLPTHAYHHAITRFEAHESIFGDGDRDALLTFREDRDGRLVQGKSASGSHVTIRERSTSKRCGSAQEIPWRAPHAKNSGRFKVRGRRGQLPG
jgi:hypothetical protein